GFGSATFAAFTFDEAQHLLMARPGQVSAVLVKAAPGVSQGEIVARVAAVLPSGVDAITGAQLTSENTDDINRTFLNFLRAFLVIFAAVALAVGGFSIHNTFSIVAAQRTRGLALLRALGATRGQVLTSVLLEAAVVGGL